MCFKKKKKKKIPREEELEKVPFNCELHYDKVLGREVDSLNDELKRVIVYDYNYDSFDDYAKYYRKLERGDVFNIKTKITNPKIYEFLKDDDIYHFTFLIKLDPF